MLLDIPGASPCQSCWQGVPIRLELGSKDLEKESAVLARRDTGAKETVALSDIAFRVPALLEQIHVSLSLS
jgi:prolyl-tRNA synthetase